MDELSNGIPPMPVTELTMEQEFKVRQLQDLLPEADKKDIITLFIALQRQCFVLGNNMKNLLNEWPTPQIITPADVQKYGTSSESSN